MTTLEILNIDDFSDIFEINLNKQPNQEFTTTIKEQIYKFEIKTFIDNKTMIQILKNGEMIGQGFIKCGINLVFLSKIENLAFFFLKKVNSDLIDFNYSDFGDKIGLYCGFYNDDKDLNSELETFYNLRSNTQDLAVF